MTNFEELESRKFYFVSDVYHEIVNGDNAELRLCRSYIKGKVTYLMSYSDGNELFSIADSDSTGDYPKVVSDKD